MITGSAEVPTLGGEILNSNVCFTLLKITFDDPQAWNYLLLSPVNTSDVSPGITQTLRNSTLHYQEQEHGEDWNIWIILPFIPIALFYEGQRNPENKYSGGGGISIQFSKMVFLYKCESLFQCTLNGQGFNSEQVPKPFCPQASHLDLLIHQLSFPTFFRLKIGEVILLTSV